MTNYGPDKILDLSTSFERYLKPFKWCHQTSYLRDKSIYQFGDTMNNSPWSKAEKWQIRAPTKFWIETHHLKGIWLLSNGVIKLNPIQQLSPKFSERHHLKSIWYLSNGVIKVHIWEIKVFANLAIPWIIAHGPRPKNDKLGPQRNFGLKHIIWKVYFQASQKIKIKYICQFGRYHG